MTQPEFLADYKTQIDAALERFLTKLSPSDSRLSDAMHYSALLGGKRVRPILSLATAQAFGLPPSHVLHAACAIELIHAYSLIHDDLPAMDDDDLRRGQATCHIAFDEATAILAGDALQAAAFELITHDSFEQTSTVKVKLLSLLANASGAKGMVLGQAIDLGSVGKELSLEQLENMHRHKTGKLIEVSVEMAAICCGASPTDTQHLNKYAQALGLAFQVQDDILDVTGSTDIIGKKSGADIASNKPTYVSLLGLDGAKDKLNELHQDCMNSLHQLNHLDISELAQIARYVIDRVH